MPTHSKEGTGHRRRTCATRLVRCTYGRASGPHRHAPNVILSANALPKNAQAVKIMSASCVKIAAQETEDLCDISTLSEPSVVHELIQETKRMSA